MGLVGVIVFGIVLIVIRSLGNDFIDVILNNELISLFNLYKYIIMDVLF